MASIEFDNIARGLQQMAPVGVQDRLYDDERVFEPGNGWRVKGEVNLYKIRLAGEGVFVKMYAPRTGDYAQVARGVLDELSALNLEPPVLAPVAEANGVLFFKLGEPMAKAPLGSLYCESDVRRIDQVITNSGLEPLGRFGRVDLVDVDGKRYVVDPIDDSAAALFAYVFRGKEEI